MGRLPLCSQALLLPLGVPPTPAPAMPHIQVGGWVAGGAGGPLAQPPAPFCSPFMDIHQLRRAMATVTSEHRTLEAEEVRRITACCRFVEQSFRAARTWPDTKKFPPTVLETALDGCPEAGGYGKRAQYEILRALKGRVQVPLPTPRTRFVHRPPFC